jgi:hypothetical protein
VGLGPANNNTLDDGQDQGTTNGGAETSGEGTVGKRGGGTGNESRSTKQLTRPIRARWAMAGATLRLKIDATAVGDPSVQSTDARVTTFALRAHASN